MMTSLADVFVEGRIDTSRFGSDIKSGMNSPAVRSGVDGAGKQAGGRFSSSFKNALKVGAAVAGAAAVAGGAKFLKSSITEASNLGESLNAVNVTFGKSAAGIKKLGKEAADAVGLSNTEFNGLAVQFSAFASTVAGKGGNVTKTMKELTGRGADFASVMNLEVNEAMGLFQSGLAGETEPLRKFGIDLSAAAVQAHAYKVGIAEVGGELTEQEKVQARYSLLMKSTAKTHGDFENTSDSLANSQRRLGAHFDNIQAKVGAELIPILERFSGWMLSDGLPAVERFGGFIKSDVVPPLARMGRWIKQNDDWLVPLVATLGGAVVAFKAIKVATAAWTAAQVVLNIALTANPIGVVVVAIAALTAGLVVAYKKSETFRNIVNGVWDAVSDGAIDMAKFVVNGLLWMAEKIIGVMAKIPGPTQDAFQKAEASVRAFREDVNREMDAIKDEEVKIGFAVGRRESQEGTNSGFGPQGGRGAMGGAGGAIIPRVSADTSGVARIATETSAKARDIAGALAKEWRKNNSGPRGAAGRVLPRGSYSVGMPYLGYSGHYGADYPAPAGTPVYSPFAGAVSQAMTMTDSYGKHVFLQHANGVQTRYAHLSSYMVGAGQKVGAGQMIGRVGSTGNSTGNHLHFEYRRNGSPVNPAGLGIFDRGGIMRGLGINLSGKPERVLSPRQTELHARQTAALEALATKGRRGGGSQRIVLDVGGGRTLTGIIREEIASETDLSDESRRASR